MRTDWHPLLRGLQLQADLAESLASESSTNPREKRAFFLFDVVADAFDQHLHFGVEPLIARVHPFQLR